MASEWHELLRQARRRRGMTQRELAAAAGIPVETLRGYERGHRRPRRERLETLFGALGMPREEEVRLLDAAGLTVPATLFPLSIYPDYFFTVDELQAEVEAVPWPEFVLNNTNEVVAANTAVQRLWGVDFMRERATRSRAKMNILAVASQLRFAERILNWDECIAIMAGVFKGGPVSPASIDQPDPYFNEVLNEFAAGDPAFVARMAAVWVATLPRPPKVRWAYPVEWDEPGVGVVHFHGLVSTASEPAALSFNDWIPKDAASWSVLEQLKDRQPPAR